MNAHWDVVIIGAGAAGLMCAIEAGKRGRKVLLVDHAAKPAEKIRISGGGRCNFTNLGASGAHYLGANPKFALSALTRFSAHDFLARIERAGIDWVEKAQGQLFCRDGAQVLIDYLLAEMRRANVVLKLETEVTNIRKTDAGFVAETGDVELRCASLVIATGGKSIPKMGATAFGYQIAEQFALALEPTRAGLVPLTFDPDFKAQYQSLVGIGVEARITSGKQAFIDGLLFTHRGLSGPSILQISSFWQPGDELEIDLLPVLKVEEILTEARQGQGGRLVHTVLAQHMPQALAQLICEETGVAEVRVGDLGRAKADALATRVHRWRVKPTGSEGYRTAEVTLGGVSTAELNAKTMEARHVSGLYFIGEVVDVTGWLGGYNFQWAWSSGWAAGQVC